jgi:hypothetical protein
MDGLVEKYGPAEMAINGCPQTVNDTMSQSPEGVLLNKVTLLTLDSGNTEQ